MSDTRVAVSSRLGMDSWCPVIRRQEQLDHALDTMRSEDTRALCIVLVIGLVALALFLLWVPTKPYPSDYGTHTHTTTITTTSAQGGE